MDKPIYTEDFVRTVDPDNIDYKIAAVIEAHPASSGWVVGEPRVEKVSGGQVRLIIPLSKYDVANNVRKMHM